jgi:hypothetical protein
VSLSAKDLGSTRQAMAREGLLRRVETGRYVAEAESGRPPARHCAKRVPDTV